MSWRIILNRKMNRTKTETKIETDQFQSPLPQKTTILIILEYICDFDYWLRNLLKQFNRIKAQIVLKTSRI